MPDAGWKQWVRPYAAAFGVLALGGVSARVSSWMIDELFPGRVAPDDLVFRLFPYIDLLQYVADWTLLAAVGCITWYTFRRDAVAGPHAVAIIGAMHVIRGPLNVMTPLGSPMGDGSYWGIIDYVQNGMFPSGHTATALIIYLTVDRAKAPMLKRTLLVLFVVECFALVAGRGHYSIDVIGGAMLAYIVHIWWQSGRFARLRRAVTPRS